MIKLREPADLRSALARALPPPVFGALAAAAELARAAEMPCYLVGGPVRDLLLGRPIDDLDLVFEGDAVAIAERFANQTGGKLTRHAAFGTANVTWQARDQTLDIDFVTARQERYPEPAALPLVQPSGIAADLLRRDFTINTLALDLRDPAAFTLLDLYGGRDDLRAGVIRVLHDRSFVDDPTRILRAARFAARLGFAVEPQTNTLIVEAVIGGMIERTSPPRILHELWLTFDEPKPQDVLRVLDTQGALPHIIPQLEWTAELAAKIAAVRTLDLPAEMRRLILLQLIASSLPEAGRQAFIRRYGFATMERRLIDEAARLPQIFRVLDQAPPRASELDQLLHSLSETTLTLGEIIASPAARARIEHYRRALRPARTLLTGDDLAALGIPPGPRYRTLLQELRAAQLDGLIRTRAEAEQWVLQQDV